MLPSGILRLWVRGSAYHREVCGALLRKDLGSDIARVERCPHAHGYLAFPMTMSDPDPYRG